MTAVAGATHARGIVTGLFHGGITVSEMDLSLAFYRDGLGLELEYDRTVTPAAAPYLPEVLALRFTELRIVYLRIAGADRTFVELLEYRGLERRTAAARPSDPGGGHLCLYVDDARAMHRRLTMSGYRCRSDGPVEVTAGPNCGAWAVYMIDPDGYLVELFQPPPSHGS